MSVASVSSVIAVLVILGMVLIFMTNIQHIATTVEGTIELKAFLDVDIQPEQIQQVLAELKKDDRIESIEFESKEDALEKFSQQIGDRKDLMAGFEENNPMQNAFIIGPKDPNEVREIVQSISGIQGVDEVKYGEEIIEKILQSTYFVRVFTIIITLILSGVSIFIISNTIKLTVFSRKREISIMKYVGATNWFVRWPFIIEGAIIGILGAIFSILILSYGYYYFTGLAQNSILSMISTALVPAREMIGQVTFYFIIAGLLIGIFGSLLSIRRFLRV